MTATCRNDFPKSAAAERGREGDLRMLSELANQYTRAVHPPIGWATAVKIASEGVNGSADCLCAARHVVCTLVTADVSEATDLSRLERPIAIVYASSLLSISDARSRAQHARREPDERFACTTCTLTPPRHSALLHAALDTHRSTGCRETPSPATPCAPARLQALRPRAALSAR